MKVARLVGGFFCITASLVLGSASPIGSCSASAQRTRGVRHPSAIDIPLIAVSGNTSMILHLTIAWPPPSISPIKPTMPPRKAAKAYQGPPLFLSLAWETRARIYQYYFPGARVRFTRPTDGSKARVYYKSKIDLMLICCTVYLGSVSRSLSLKALVL